MGDFQQDLFGCFEDINMCLLGTFIPCYVGAIVKAQVDERECTICDALCYPNVYLTRQQIRAKYGMDMNPFHDCLMSIIFGLCMNCQHHRELGDRGGK